jgi:hypothetical protein
MSLNPPIVQEAVKPASSSKGVDAALADHPTDNRTIADVIHALSALQEVVEGTLNALVRVRLLDEDAQPTSAHDAYFDFNAGLLIRRDADPTELPDDLSIRLLEKLLRQGRPVSCVDWLLLQRFKIKQIRNGVAVGDPSHAFRHDIDALRKFLGLAGVSIRIKPGHGGYRAEFNSAKTGSNVIRAAHFAREARARLRSSNISDAHHLARQALATDAACWSAGMVLSRVAQTHAALLTRDDVLRAELSLGHQIMVAVAAILRLSTKAASGFEQLARAHQRALNLVNWLRRSAIALRSSTPPGQDEFRKMLDAIMEVAVAVGRGTRGAALVDLAKAQSLVTLANQLLAGHVRENHPDRAEIIQIVTTRIVWLMLIHGVLPTVTSETGFVKELHDFLKRRLDWPSLLGRNDRRTIQYDDEAFESDEDDPHQQRSHRGTRRRQRGDRD